MARTADDPGWLLIVASTLIRGLVYFLVVSAIGSSFMALREAPWSACWAFGWAEPLHHVAILLAVLLAARWVIEAPWPMRVAEGVGIGLVALGLTVSAQAIAVRATHGVTWVDHVAMDGWAVAALQLAYLVALAAMPVIMLTRGGRTWSAR